MTFTKPMLAASLLKPSDKHDDETILKAMEWCFKIKPGPRLATLKKDGIRGIKLGDLASRTLKKIPNLSIQERSKKLPYYFDMELWNSSLSYDEVESIVMSREHPDSDLIQFHVLDIVNSLGYLSRLAQINEHYITHCRDYKVESVPVCNNAQELFEFFIACEKDEGEGICFRTPDSPYKMGRSTLKEQYLVKLARFETAEATIIGYEEQMANTNSEKRNAVGSMDRASFKAGLVPKGTLGALVVVDCKSGVEFKIGTGFTDIQRRDFWNNREHFIGSTIVYRCKRHGEKIKPRCPTYKGFRKEGF